MAKETAGNYRETETYKKMSAEEKKELLCYQKENRITDPHLYLLLYREDLRSLPKEEKQKGNRPAEMMVISGIIVFLVMTASNNRRMLPFAGAYMLIVGAIYLTGIMNPYSRTLSNVNKLLKKNYPKVASFFKSREEK